MAIDLKRLGSKLRKYREQLQESVEDVGKTTDIASDRLAGMEEGSIGMRAADEVTVTFHIVAVPGAAGS